MMISQNKSEMPYKTIPNAFAWAILAVGFLGFVDALYLTAKRFLGSPLQCYFFGGCDAVNSSPYSNLLGIPLSLYGSVFYLLVVLTAVYYLQSKNPVAVKALMALTSLGLLFACYTFSLQAFVIKAYCFYCVLSMVTSTANFVLMFIAWKKYFSKESNTLSEEKI